MASLRDGCHSWADWRGILVEITFTVPGILPGWQRTGQSGKRHFTQDQTRAAQLEVAAWARQAARGVMLKGPLGLHLTVWFPVPESWSIKKKDAAYGGWMAQKPDGDNLFKLVGDSVNKVAYADDALIADARVVKRYADLGDRARSEFRLWELME
jgi:Holliday junction resolvase RusA-like endonuclease